MQSRRTVPPEPGVLLIHSAWVLIRVLIRNSIQLTDQPADVRYNIGSFQALEQDTSDIGEVWLRPIQHLAAEQIIEQVNLLPEIEKKNMARLSPSHRVRLTNQKVSYQYPET